MDLQQPATLAPKRSLPDANLSFADANTGAFARLDTIAFALLALFVAVAPFPYGAILPGGNFQIEIFAFVIAALAFFSRPAGRRLGGVLLPAAALILIAVLGVIQILPMESSTLRGISPVSAEAHRTASEILQLFGRPPTRPMISIAPAETAATILLTLAYAALLLSAAMLVRTRERQRWLVAVLFATSAAHILYAILSGPVDRIHGAFVNPDHFAGYLEIALAFAFGTIWGEVLVNRDRGEGIRDRGDRLEKRALPIALRVLLWGVIAAGIGLTKSRGAVLTVVVVTPILLLMGTLHRPIGMGKRRALVATSLAFVVSLTFVGISTGAAPLLRFLTVDPTDLKSDERVTMWITSVKAWHLFPNTGSGLGAFREAFRRVQPRELSGLVEQSHNDFLQLLVTGGWIGATLGAITFCSMLFLLLRGWRRQQHREESAFILAGFGALLSLTLHGAVEFNMSLPAIPATLAVMVGAAWAAAIGPALPARRSSWSSAPIA